jgi:hypothetical protein
MDEQVYTDFILFTSTPLHAGHCFADALCTKLTVNFRQKPLGILLQAEFKTKKKLNSVALVRKRTIPTERPPLSAK